MTIIQLKYKNTKKREAGILLKNSTIYRVHVK